VTEQPATSPEPIRQSAFPTGRGGRWGAHLDSPLPSTEPYQPKPRTRPAAGWPKTGDVGASATLGADEEPVTVPARAYASAEVAEGEVPQVASTAGTPSLGAAGSSLGAAMHTCADNCQCDETRCSSCADTGHACEDHPDRPWGGITDDINGCHCGGAGVPCPACCDPIPEDGSTSIGAAFTPRKFAQGKIVDVTKPGFGIVSIAEARSWGIEPPPAVELLAMADDLNAHGGLDETFVAGLLRQVVDDDAPSVLNAESVLKVRGELTEEEFEQMRADWLRALDEAPRPYQVISAGPPFRGYIREIITPRPWWRRTLDRVRRWGR
jgi:hypothetical protein